MQDVAEKAGVSAQTVSNVINGRTERVSEETIARVAKIIDDLGYRLNQSARSLRKGRTGLVGLGVPVLASEYYGELAERLSHRFASRGLRLITERTGGQITAEVESLAASHLETYDGFILAVAGSVSADLHRVTPTKPILLLGERALSARFDHVLMDNVGGAALATGFLLDRGARSIVVLGGSLGEEPSVQTLRTQGYLEAHADRGAEVRPDLVIPAGLDMSDGYRAIADLLERGARFDGIFALTDSSAFGALRALAEYRVRVPADVQIVGFDNVRAAEYHVPRLTTIEPGNDEMADAIVELMWTRLHGEAVPASPQRHVMPARLVERDTTR